MDLLTNKQRQINKYKSQAVEQYPAIWSKIIKQWQKPGSQDRAWLMYSANYLFRTKNVRWALDPFSLRSRISLCKAMDIANDLSIQSFVILTHSHTDHLDLGLIRELKDTSARWIVPSTLFETVISAGIKPDLIIVPEVLIPIELDGITITPFDGLHFHKNKNDELLGVPSLGYLVEQGRKRWLFPGDTRTYQPELLPSFGPVDTVFAHLWLGKSSALQKFEWQIDKFCRFFLELKPKMIYITHLRELGRGAKDFWDMQHAKLIQSRLKELSPETEVSIALMGQKINM